MCAACQPFMASSPYSAIIAQRARAGLSRTHHSRELLWDLSTARRAAADGVSPIRRLVECPRTSNRSRRMDRQTSSFVSFVVPPSDNQPRPTTNTFRQPRKQRCSNCAPIERTGAESPNAKPIRISAVDAKSLRRPERVSDDATHVGFGNREGIVPGRTPFPPA